MSTPIVPSFRPYHIAVLPKAPPNANPFANSNARLRRSPVTPGTPDRGTSLDLPEGNQPSTTPVAGQPALSNPLPSADAIGADQSSGRMATADEVLASYHLPTPKPLWLNGAYAKHIVKGNFMTLSARPKTVEMGEWVGHQGSSWQTENH